jgi:hypothetical protein
MAICASVPIFQKLSNRVRHFTPTAAPNSAKARDGAVQRRFV